MHRESLTDHPKVATGGDTVRVSEYVALHQPGRDSIGTCPEGRGSPQGTQTMRAPHVVECVDNGALGRPGRRLGRRRCGYEQGGHDTNGG